MSIYMYSFTFQYRRKLCPVPAAHHAFIRALFAHIEHCAITYFLLFNRFHICRSVILGFFGNRLSGDTSLQSVLVVQGQSIEMISAKHFPPYDVVAIISRPVPAAYHAFIFSIFRARSRAFLNHFECRRTNKSMSALFP